MHPCEENGNQESALVFYGSSFITDATGELAEQDGREEEQVLLATFDLDEVLNMRRDWRLYRDRRPDYYGNIVK